MNQLLLIEDSHQIASLMQAAFQSQGWQVIVVTNGLSGLELAKEGGFAAIITDLKMPEMDGLEFLEKLHAITPPKPNGPIVVYTSATYDFAPKKALASGAALFIAKDTPPSEVVRQVIGLITGAQAEKVKNVQDRT